MKALIREKKVESGDFLEVDLFEVRNTSKTRKKKAFVSRPVQVALNHKNSTRKLKWLLQSNFTDSDYHVVLSYPADFEVSIEESKKIIKKFLRRIRNRFKARGYEFKYVYVTEIGEEKGRPHHHLIASGDLGKEIFKIEWNKQFDKYKKSKDTSYVWTENLEESETGFEALAQYLTKSRRSEEPDEDDEEELVSYKKLKYEIGFRSYNCSKNLKKPIIKTRDGVISRKRFFDFISNCDNREMFEKQYPGYDFICADSHWHDVYSALKHLGTEYYDFPHITILLKKREKKDSKKDSIIIEKPKFDEYECCVDAPDYWDDDFDLPY